MIGLMLLTTGLLQRVMMKSVNFLLRQGQNVGLKTTGKKGKSSGPDSDKKAKKRQADVVLNGPTGNVPHPKQTKPSTSQVATPVKPPRQSSSAPTAAPSAQGRAEQPLTNKRDTRNKGGASKETFGGFKQGFLSQGAKPKVGEAQQVGKARKSGGRKRRKSRERRKSCDKASEKARAEQKAAEAAAVQAAAGMLTAWPNARVGTRVSAAMYPPTPIMLSHALSTPDHT